MRSALVPTLAWFGISLALLVASLQGGCGGSAVGVEACRKIEATRCNALTACGKTEAEAAYCNELYRDQCLYGIENAASEPTDGMVSACVSALQAVETCARAGAKTMVDCPTATLIASASPQITPCQIIQRNPELLASCSFIAAPADAGATETPDSGSTDDAGSDAGDAGG